MSAPNPEPFPQPSRFALGADGARLTGGAGFVRCFAAFGIPQPRVHPATTRRFAPGLVGGGWVWLEPGVWSDGDVDRFTATTAGGRIGGQCGGFSCGLRIE